MIWTRRDLALFAKVACIGVGLVAGSYVLNRPADNSAQADDDPPSLTEPTTTIEADAYGQFHVAALANGAALRFLIDTGASDVTFRKQDAVRLGLNPSRLVFDRTYWTANGRIRGASFRLHRLVIGSCVLTDVVASINGGDLEEPLLGMSLLRQMKVTVADGTMTLNCKGAT